MNASPTATGARHPFAIGIALLTVIGFGLRIFRLSNQSFWTDEVSSILAAQGPFHGIYERSMLAANSLPWVRCMMQSPG